MPSKKELLEQLRKEVEQEGRGEERAFLGDVRKAQQERVENKKQRTIFKADTGSPEIYVSLNKSKDFVFDHIENKTVAWTVLAWAWARLRDKELLDKILAEGPHGT